MTATIPSAAAQGGNLASDLPKGVGRRSLLAGAGAAGAAGGLALAGCGPASTIPAVAMPAQLAKVGVGTAVASAVMPTVRVTVEVHKAALVGQLYAYLNDPHFSINPHPVVEDWSKRLELPSVLLEALRMEGDLTPEHVEQFVDGIIGARGDVIFY